MAGEEKKKDLSDLVLERGGGVFGSFPKSGIVRDCCYPHLVGSVMSSKMHQSYKSRCGGRI